MINKTLKLHNNIEIPVIGFGTWLIPNIEAKSAVLNAINSGYKHIDTAQAYLNEEGVGEGIRESKVKREELFLTTKIKGEIKDYQTAKNSIDESLRKLGTDYIDLMIIHCPQPWAEFRSEKRYFKENIEVWKALEEAYEDGKVKAIGVSNFLIDDLQNLIDNVKIKPMVNQILTHIGETPLDLIEYCQENGIVVEAYSPIAHGAALHSKNIIMMANKYNVSVAQLCIRYTIQLGMVTLPKSTNAEHIKSNTEVNFIISDEDMEILKAAKTMDYGQDIAWPVFAKRTQK